MFAGMMPKRTRSASGFIRSVCKHLRLRGNRAPPSLSLTAHPGDVWETVPDVPRNRWHNNQIGKREMSDKGRGITWRKP